jgi:hypothetical protein
MIRNGVINVTLGTGSATTNLDGNYSTFTGTINLGNNSATGKASMNGAQGALVNDQCSHQRHGIYQWRQQSQCDSLSRTEELTGENLRAS